MIPGNHDIPTFPPARFTRPWREFKREWETTRPVYSSPTLEVVGLNSVRPLGYQRGRVPSAELDARRARLGAAQPGALRMVAIHHQLAGAPWRSRKLPLLARSRVLERLAAAGAELIVGGHIHQATVVERAPIRGARRTAPDAASLATAPGLGRPRPGRRYEVRGVLVHRADEQAITVETHVWRDDDWSLTGTRTFPRT